MELQGKITKAFFDSKKVIDELDKKTHYVLNRFGGTVRKTAQRSMRTRKGTSPSGSPPYSHGDKKLKKFLYYSYDRANKIVVIGPVKFGRTASLHVPSTLEHGGTITVQTKKGSIEKVYPERPYMNPAFMEHQGKVASWYKEAK